MRYIECPTCGGRMDRRAVQCRGCRDASYTGPVSVVGSRVCPDCDGPKWVYAHRCRDCHNARFVLSGDVLTDLVDDLEMGVHAGAACAAVDVSPWTAARALRVAGRDDLARAVLKR